MPSQYAHKKFGALVYKRLPDELRRIIAENKNEYLIALHGPDPFFFCMPSKSERIVEIALRHHQRSFSYLQDAAFKVINGLSDGPELSYFYGMICHFVLDTFCHPLVDKAIAETGLSHGKIETEFERYLLDKDGLDSLSYPAYAHLPIDKATAEVAARFYDDATASDFYHCMKCMKVMLLAVAPKNHFYKNSAAKVMSAFGYSGKVASLIMSRDPSSLCKKNMKEMEKELYASVDRAVSEILDFTAMIMSGEKNNTFISNRDFSGNIW